MLVLTGQAPVSADAFFTNATLPAVAASAIVPEASAVGSREPVAPPASWTK
jgi:hypothetical protein